MQTITHTTTHADQLGGSAAASDGEWRSIGQVADAVVSKALHFGAPTKPAARQSSPRLPGAIHSGCHFWRE